MKVSYNWLQSYFKEPLPAPTKLAELFTFRFAEVESVDAVGNDTVLDVKVLPDRAHYALCHRGIATEVAAITGAPIVIPIYAPNVTNEQMPGTRIDNETLCRRYTARFINDVTVGDSPDWLKERLTAIGQRPINNIVDAANFVMFDMGQPLHAFDADKVQGAIVVRMAKAGEQMTTLDGKDVALTSDILVIADDTGVLAIAGIKGGTRAQVDASTRRIILESANFDPAYIRKASGLVGIRTDASKRFENEITPEWAATGSDLCAALIGELCPGAVIGKLTDSYPVKTEMRTLSFDPTFVSKMLGVEISTNTMIKILSSLGISSTLEGAMLMLAVPPERLDLVLPEDIAEEIGRIYGYENIPPVAPPKLVQPLVPLKSMHYEEAIRDALIAHGFSEVFTYSFQKSGELEIEKSLASDKNFLRPDLMLNMLEAVEHNEHYVDLLGIDDVKIFEIGKVFNLEYGEQTMLAVGIRKMKKEKGIIAETLLIEVESVIGAVFGMSVAPFSFKKQMGANGILQIPIDAIIASLPDPTAWNIAPYYQENTAYKKISSYPFMVRDIAMFVPVETKQEEIAELLKAQARELLAMLRLFDIFTKTFPDGSQKTSYAFRLVFQSHDRTLSDEDANSAMERVTLAVVGKGWEVR